MKISCGLVLIVCGLLSACVPQGFQDLVKLQGGLRRNDETVLRPYLRDTNAANVRLPRRAPGQFTYPLIVASDTGNTNAVKALLQAGADANAPDSRGETALMAAMTSESDDDAVLTIASLLIMAKADVRQQDASRTDALQLAARYRTPSFLLLLLQAGAEPNSADVNGDTDLHQVRTATNAVLLLRFGATLNATNRNGETPLSKARTDPNPAVSGVLEKAKDMQSQN